MRYFKSPCRINGYGDYCPATYDKGFVALIDLAVGSALSRSAHRDAGVFDKQNAWDQIKTRSSR